MTASTRRPPPAVHALLGWRRRLLVEAGFPADLAVALAADLRRDLHALIRLTEQGCPPRLAARILAPLEEERP